MVGPKALLGTALLLVLLLCRPAASAVDLFAHAAGSTTWVAQVERGPAARSTTDTPPGEQTHVVFRQSGPAEQWQPLMVLPGRITSMASRSSQLAVLLEGGQWMTLWTGGAATGEPLPADGRIVTLADDGETLWALGRVDGGLAAATAPPTDPAAVRPSTAPATARAATTGPATLAVVTTAPARLPPKLVVFHQDAARWVAVAELPGDAVGAPAVSLTVIERNPVVAYQSTPGNLRVLRWSNDHTWDDVGSAAPGEGAGAQVLKVMDGGKGSPVLWWTTGNRPGQLAPDVAARAHGMSLPWGKTGPIDALPTAAMAGGYLRVIASSGDDVFEQRYDLQGKPVGDAVRILANGPGEAAWPGWVQAFVLLSLTFAVGANAYRQWTPSQAADVSSPRPAPLTRRAAAGLVDLLPLIVGMAFFVHRLNQAKGAVPTVGLAVLIASLFVYLLHTTLAEVLTARSAGKWLLGLKVVTVAGTAPAVGQLLGRNVLRVIDPLVLVFFSPLNQRSADAAVGTMVVSADVETPEPPVADDEEPGPTEPAV